MANYSAIKAAVNAYIKTNGKKEITGHILNSVLNTTIDSLGRFFQFAGGAMPTDDPGTPDQNVCYLAGEPGVYTNFGGITIENEEVALLFWNGEWTKQRILIGIQEVEVSVDNQVGTPSVDVSYSGGQLVLTFHNLKGETGDAAGFGTIGADINGGVGTPGVSVESSGDNTAKNLMFHFTNLKGETGVTSVVATIDDTSGTPSCQVSLVNGVLTLAFSGLKGIKGDTGVSADYPITLYNGLDSDATDQALTAAQGVVLDGKISQLGQDVTDLVDVVGTERETPTYTTSSGYYVASNAIVRENSSFSMTSVIPIRAGDTIFVSGRGNSLIAVIAETNESGTSFIVKVIGRGNATDDVYSYTFESDTFCIVSYYRLNSIGIRHNTISNINKRIDDLTDAVEGEESVTKAVEQYLPEFANLKIYSFFNGENTTATSANIDIANEGDSLEIDLYPNEMTGNQHYGLVNWSVAQVSIGCTQSALYVRAYDRSWIAQGISIGGTKAHFVLKIAFEEGKINIYVDGTLMHTYNGQKLIRLSNWGVYSSGGDNYWNGKVGYIKINDTTYDSLAMLPGWNTTTIKTGTENGFLTEAQASLLAQSGDYPNIFISAASESVNVYNKVHDNIYVKFTINHQVDTSTGQYKYKDLWRIASQGDLCVYNGESFTSLGVKLLVSAENEFAIKFAGFLDFTGGYHGYERIDLDPSCYCVFVLDGKEYTISDLVSLGDVDGNSFEYRQKSFCYTDSGYSQSPIHFANHVKRTSFERGGFVTRNYFETIMDGLSVSTLTAETAFEGLVCVSEDCADKVVGVDGTIYSTTHPATSVILVNNINKTSRFVKMFNGAASCCLDAKMIGTSVSGYATPGNRVQIMDRADDTKYYAYLPSNVAWGDGDAMEVECVVKYDYRQYSHN